MNDRFKFRAWDEGGGPDGSLPLIESEIIGNIYENPNLLKND